MNQLGHGANVEDICRKYNKKIEDIIDFSSNINSKVITGLENYILESLDKCKSYPDINYVNLRNNISNYINIDPQFIIPGNGATEIIYLMMKSIGKKIAILNPTFSEYERSARLNDLEIVSIDLDKDNNFALDINKIKEKINNFDSLFICNPNNPNGKIKELEELLELIVENNKLLIVDETFMEFVEDEHKYSLLKYVEKYENIFILKAVTKFFGMPGLRLGYGVTSNKEIIKNIYKYKEPWTINSFAEHLSNYIFKDVNYISDSKAFYIKERQYMMKELSSIKYLVPYETDTNFMLIRLIDVTASELKELLLEKGNILIRDASNFIGLDESYIRVAIKSHEENKKLIEVIKNLLGD